MTVRIGDLLAGLPAEKLFGRARELGLLMCLVEADRPILMHVHGIPGIGKSALLHHFTTRAREAGASVTVLDCRSIEPTEQGFLQALGAAVGHPLVDIRSAADHLETLGSRVLLLLDQFDQLRLMDVWLRETFITALPCNIRIATFSRQPPGMHWLAAPGWRRLMTSLQLDALTSEDAHALLRDAGVSEADVDRIASAGRGHPLVLHLAARAWLEHPGRSFDEFDISGLTCGLAKMALSDAADPAIRRAAEAASIVRRVTEPLLTAIFPAEDAQRLYAQLSELPIMKQHHDGLALHESVRHAVAATFIATDPDRAQDYRAAVWRHTHAKIGKASATELWRNTADAIYLLQSPVIRSAFFPDAPRSLAARPAQPSDADDILQIVREHEGPEATHHLSAWWTRQRGSFHVIENADRKIIGFYCLAASTAIDPFLLVEDPVTANWWRHLRDNPMRRGEKALFLRRWLSSADGELPSAVQAECWLDIKRTYLELRPELRRVYLTLREMAPYEQAAGRLGFQSIDGAAALDGHFYQSVVLDFGPNSVDGWISELLGRELGQDCIPTAANPLDAGARELVLGDQRIALTAKEFALLDYLHAHNDRAVSRDELLADIWGWKVGGGSNVVDALIRALRRKLGAQSDIIETVRGIGYRYRSPAG
jgi:hypothetical protein